MQFYTGMGINIHIGTGMQFPIGNAYQTTFIPVMHQPYIKGIEEYMYEVDRMYAKEKDMRNMQRCSQIP
jgi:hypothetical protein